jgi:hypothetical protein
MFNFYDLFQWNRFITPSIIKLFYWLAVILTVGSGLVEILAGIALMTQQLLGGLFLIVGSLIGMLTGIILVRILSEFVLVTFSINEHLGAIRGRDNR